MLSWLTVSIRGLKVYDDDDDDDVVLMLPSRQVYYHGEG